MNCSVINNRKKYFDLTEKGPQAQQVKEVLLVKLASLKEPEKVTEFFNEFKTGNHLLCNHSTKESHMSKTIAINAGSSSLKWQLYQMPEETVVAKGIVERIGLQDSILPSSTAIIKIRTNHGYRKPRSSSKMLLDQLIELQILSSYDEITG